MMGGPLLAYAKEKQQRRGERDDSTTTMEDTNFFEDI